MIERQISELASRVLHGNHMAIGRAISMCDPAAPEEDREQLIDQLWPHTGQAETIGLTGPPGVGKSTLVSELIAYARKQGRTVGAVAVDPTSPDSGGALLGDRIRMRQHYLDSGVFIRSMGTGGHWGGVAEATFLAMSVLDASGKDLVIVETVGVGQSEVEVRHMVDTIVVALQPGSGDSIQAMKSGLMEIPDVLCLNKSDLPDAQDAKRDLKSVLNYTNAAERPFLAITNAKKSEGIDRLWQFTRDHRARLGENGLQRRRRENLGRQIAAIAASRAAASFDKVLHDESGQRLLDNVASQIMNPLQAAKELRT